MTVFGGAMEATFAAFGVDAIYTPAGGQPVSVRVIAKRPDTIVGFGETRIHTETASLARAREHDLAVLSEQLLPAAEAGLVEALSSAIEFWMTGLDPPLVDDRRLCAD